ncbi:MAG: hypothetical protein RL311_1186 [Bacteroidota bacterium]|jgi:hypothetical protein
MEKFWILVIVVIIGFSIKSLRDYKNLSNDSYYNILQNSRHYRLLAIIIVSVIALFICLVRMFR